MVIEFTTTCAISAYHHWRCEFESRSCKMYSIQHYVIKFVSDLRQVGGFLRILLFPQPIKLTANITVILLKVALNIINQTYIKVFTDVLLEWADFYSFQIYEWIISFPLQYINGWWFISYVISVGHISKRPYSFFIIKTNYSIIMLYFNRDRRGRDRMVVGFPTTYAISAYHRWCCEFESRSGLGVQHFVIKFASDLRQVSCFFRGPPVSSTNITDCHDITEILLKYHQTNKHIF
jgi:hypothetical protein